MKILAMRKENYIGKVVDDYDDYHPKYKDEEMTRHYLYVNEAGSLFEICLEEEFGMCPSGYTTASWGKMEIKEVSEIPENSLKCTVDTDFDMPKRDTDHYECDIFSLDVYGGDEWYPSGSYNVNEDFFNKE